MPRAKSNTAHPPTRPSRIELIISSNTSTTLWRFLRLHELQHRPHKRPEQSDGTHRKHNCTASTITPPGPRAPQGHTNAIHKPKKQRTKHEQSHDRTEQGPRPGRNGRSPAKKQPRQPSGRAAPTNPANSEVADTRLRFLSAGPVRPTTTRLASAYAVRTRVHCCLPPAAPLACVCAPSRKTRTKQGVNQDTKPLKHYHPPPSSVPTRLPPCLTPRGISSRYVQTPNFF